MARGKLRVLALAAVVTVGGLAFAASGATPATYADHARGDSYPDNGEVNAGNGTMPDASETWMRWLDESAAPERQSLLYRASPYDFVDLGTPIPVYADTVTCTAPIQVTSTKVEVTKDYETMQDLSVALCQLGMAAGWPIPAVSVCEGLLFGAIVNGLSAFWLEQSGFADVFAQERLPARIHAFAAIVPYTNGTPSLGHMVPVALTNGMDVALPRLHPAADTVVMGGLVFGVSPTVQVTYDAPAGTECAAAEYTP